MPMPTKPKLLEQVRQLIHTKHDSIRTEEAYVQWVKRFVLFHQKRHPAEMGGKEISAYLNHLSLKQNVAASTQNQGLCAIVFLYREVLKKNIADFGDSLIWAKKSIKLPEVFTPEETQAVLSHLEGIYWLTGILMYGAGLRIIECLRLRIKDIDFTYNKITVREGKGAKDRVTMLPQPFQHFWNYTGNQVHENRVYLETGRPWDQKASQHIWRQLNLCQISL